MYYNGPGKDWNGTTLDIQVKSNNVLTAPADVRGNWQADSKNA